MYSRKNTQTAIITPTFPVFPRLANPIKTSWKSISFGVGRSSPPNEVRWLQKHCKLSSVEFGPGCVRVDMKVSRMKGGMTEKINWRKKGNTVMGEWMNERMNK